MISRDTTQTIYAIATGAGKAAVAIIRVSGAACASILALVCPGVRFVDRIATFATVRGLNGDVLDHSIVIRFHSPRSFTGEDVVEFQVTGSRAVLAELIRTIASVPGTRPAEPGEFARRAFLSGRRDLAEIEGLASLIDAETSAQLRHAIRMASGELSRRCEHVRALILQSMSIVESMLDFSDVEDSSEFTRKSLTAPLTEALDQLERLLDHEGVSERLRDGMTIVIAGPPNAGKSTLMNALARRDVSIVSESPGTTRDALEVNTEISGFPVMFVDTAGIRDSDDPVEAEGIARARKRSAGADMTLWLRSVTAVDEEVVASAGSLLQVITKIDLQPKTSIAPGVVAISAKTGVGMAELIARIDELAQNHFAGAGAAIFGTERQRGAARDAEVALRRILAASDLGLEIVAEELRFAAAAMGRITGRIEVEEILGEIFSRLCVGK